MIAKRKTSRAPRRRIPHRTCVACRQVRPARELIRIVRLPTGAVEIDELGKKSGRGAYLCPDAACWEKALAKSLLEHALKTKITDDGREALRQRWGSLAKASAEEQAAFASQ